MEKLIFPENSNEKQLHHQTSEGIYFNDLSFNLPREALNWLKKYGITDEEINENQFQWSPSARRLVLPVRVGASSCRLETLWESRGFDKKYAKSLFQGSKKDAFHVISPKIAEVQGVIAVEDIISAIKVGRVARSLCLFGSAFPIEYYNKIKVLAPLLVVWLDNDKLDQAFNIARKGESFGLETKVVRTELDPKCYSTKEIQLFLKVKK